MRTASVRDTGAESWTCGRRPPGCCACCRCCRPGGTGRARTSRRASASPSAPCAATWTATCPPSGTVPTVAPDTLTVLAGACRDSERLRFTYSDRDGATSVRAVEPHRLVHTGRRWYLVAYDLDRADWRTFRVDRLE